MSIDQDIKSISHVVTALEAFRNGEMIIMVDDEDRENEGDLVFPAQFVTPEKINFMSKHARGLICLAMEPALVDRLKLPMMEDVGKSTPQRETAFTVSIEAKRGVTTGISAADRCETIRVAVDEQTTQDDLVVPGHIFPLRARQGGVLERAGHTEGSVDLARLADLKPAAVICEIMNDDGTMARMNDLRVLAEKFKIPLVSIADLIMYRLQNDSIVEKLSTKKIRTNFGVFDATIFQSRVDGLQHLAIHKGQELFDASTVDVRVHSQRPIVDVFADDENGGRFRIEYALRFLSTASCGVMIYFMRPEACEDLIADLNELADEIDGEPSRGNAAASHRPMDPRQYGVGAQILRALGVRRMRLHLSAPKALVGLAGFGLEVVEKRSNAASADGEF